MQEKIRSVGIDIGTSTTQFVLSMLTVKNVAPGSLVPKMEITDKEIIYRSDIHMTPIGLDDLVDGEKLFALLLLEFNAAGISPEEIDTGAVIITGETAKKENARIISDKVADFAGDFVVATAGGKLESIIAGRGSGAADYSRRNYSTIANIDIGGGTANIGIFKNGDPIDSCCLNVGGRLLQLEKNSNRVTQISRPMEQILAATGVRINPGEEITESNLVLICDAMVAVIIECLQKTELKGLAGNLLMTEALRLDYSIDQVMISGGVADFVYGSDELTQSNRYGDIGPLFGNRLRKLWGNTEWQLVEPTETIRATVIGAGSQTVDVSGSTILVDERLLPFKNMPVALVSQDIADLSEPAVAIKRSIENYLEEGSLDNVAIGLRGCGYLSFAAIQVLAKGIVDGASQILKSGKPLVVVLEHDIGKVLGQSLKALGFKNGIVCIDQLVVQEGDYIDVGRPMANGSVVPVVIKSLVFETKQI